MPSPKLIASLHAGVMTLSLNRPDKLNAIDNDVARALLQALQAALQPEITRRFKRVLNEIGAASFSRAIELENEAQRALSDQVALQGRPQGPG